MKEKKFKNMFVIVNEIHSIIQEISNEKTQQLQCSLIKPLTCIK